MLVGAEPSLAGMGAHEIKVKSREKSYEKNILG